MEKIGIRFWHGNPGDNHPMTQKLNAIATCHPGDYWEYTKSLTEFASEWGEKFLYYPSSKTMEGMALIYVTQHGGWGMR